MRHLGDITKIHNAPPVDVVTGGSPCQDLSIAGKRAGLAGERSGLFMEQIRIVKEIRKNGNTNNGADELVRPGRFLVWENVYGAFSSNNGEDFRVVLEEMCRIKDPNANVPRPTNGKWAKAGLIMGNGYSVGWRLHDAQYHGVPQRRRRLCVLADLDGDAAGRILFELRRKTASGELIETFGYLGEESRPEVQSVSESMPRNSEQGEQERQGTSADATGCIGETGSITFQERAGKPGGGKGLLIQNERAGALACHPQNVCFNSWDVQSKHIQPESGVAETLYSGECRYGGGESYVLQEQKVGVLNDHGGDVIGTSEEMTGTLRAEDHGHPPVIYGFQGQAGAEASMCIGNNVSPSLVKTKEAMVYGISPYDSNAMKSDNPKAGIYEADTARTLDLNGASPVCNQGGMAVVYQGASVTSPVNASNPQPGDPCHSITTDARNYVVEVETEVSVRKYPVDTEKLIKCIQEHKSVGISEIAEKLNKPKTLVEHWFRKDKYFAIPDADIWMKLKDILGIDTDEFDESIMTFEVRPGKFDMSNRIHMGEVSPTLTANSENTMHCIQPKVFDGSRRHDYKPFGDVCETVQAQYGTGGNNVPMVVEGADLYNQELTGEVAATMNASSCGSPTHSGPSVCVHPKVYDARGNGDGKTVPTLTGDHENRITDYSAICVDQGAGKSNCIVSEEQAPTLACTHDGSPAVYMTQQAIGKYAECGSSSAVKARDYKDATDLVVEQVPCQDKVGSLMASGYSKLGTQEAKNGMYVVQKMWNGEDVSPTLTANNANGGQRMPDKDNFNAVVSFGVDCYNQSMSEEQSKALNSAATDSDHIPCTYGLDRASYNQGKNAKYNISIEAEKIGSMVAKGPGAVCARDYKGVGSQYVDEGKCIVNEQETVGSLCARDYKGVGSVRRLTPLECTRLQGYPDGWVDIGDWVDSNGKSHKDADSPKYKALGNSIALPWWQWLAYRIVAELKRSGVSDPTMGSLFSGIGGFEFVFTKAGCTPVWSSEIEEFCIAVTEKHFGNDEKGIIGDVERYL